VKPFQHGLIEAQEAIQAGEYSAREYIESCIARTRAVEPHLHAFAYFDPQYVLQQLEASLCAQVPGRLAGLPLGIKDIIATASVPTEMGSAAFKGYVPFQSAWVVEQLKREGAVIFGKTATTEFAWRQAAKTRNPWKLSHTPGGSSSGSAAAVALGCVPAALGTQTFGSVIRPAAYCGVVGFKPSFGSIPRTGIYPVAHSLDHVGVLARSVADAALVADVLFAQDNSDFYRHEKPTHTWPSDIRTTPPRIARLDTSAWGDMSVEQYATLENTANTLRAAGAIVETLKLTADFDAIWQVANTLCDAEGSQVNERFATESPIRVSQHIIDMIVRGKQVTSAAYIRAKQQQSILARSFSALLATFDAVLTAPAAGEAPSGLTNTGDAKFCIPFSVLGAPAITLPQTFSANGLPLGIQLIADWGRDQQLIETAMWVEQKLERTIRFPPIA
jgi:Asp-tRNA(Asn)/Glu-tRNA(Gln) amidotransferase A subunit family amidase